MYAGFTERNHAAYGYLLSSFSSAPADRWLRGEFENRARFSLEVVKKMWAQVGTEISIAVKPHTVLSEGRFALQHSLRVVQWLEA
jgi:2,4-dienoyl-CoA reductase-like NADH-dependent reductase (Old Yellow Enzyme family)